MTFSKVCSNCGDPFEAKRDSARFCSDACRAIDWRENGGEEGAERVLDNALQEVRDQRATKKHNRDLGGLIKQAIVDTIKLNGECHADDLVGLYPAGEVNLCRRLATAQFGSMCAARDDHGPLIQEIGRRKSSIPERKGAKSGIYSFTKHGRETLVGSSSGVYGGTGVATVRSGEDSTGLDARNTEGIAEPKSANHSSAPSTGRGFSTSGAQPRGAVSVPSVQPGEVPSEVGHRPDKSSDAPPAAAAADLGAPDSLFEQESGCSAYSTLVDEAA